MKHHRAGWTLLEMLVSLAVLALLLTLVTQSLGITQQAWLSTRTSAEMNRAADDVRSALDQVRHATLQPRPNYDEGLDQWVTESDLHFVCGPAQELIPGVPGACGDALFFQHPVHSGGLASVLTAGGFFIQYCGDGPWRPGLMLQRGSAVSKRFRLMQFHQPAERMSLFQAPALSTLSTRLDLYGWFTQPLIRATRPQEHASVVADNVVALMIQAEGAAGCYDTRRHQWEGATPAAGASRHKLPIRLEATVLLTDEAGWSRFSAQETDSLAEDLLKMMNMPRTEAVPDGERLAALRARVEAGGLKTRVMVVDLAGDGE